LPTPQKPKYHRALDILIHDSRIPKGSPVTFCRWQSTGRSVPRISHSIKNQAKWRPTEDLDILNLKKDTNVKGTHDNHLFILIDDFVGTGRTIVTLINSESSPIKKLLLKYDKSQLYILIAVGFEHGIREIKRALKQFGDRVTLSVAQLFTFQDCCFADSSSILIDKDQRDQLKSFCLKVAQEYYPFLSKDMWLGFGSLGALVVFFDTVPNNSLPIIWHDESKWNPLFPASGLL